VDSVETARDGRGGPLSGVLVADFSRILAGPYATMLMADMGADVIKVEGPKGDDTRTWMPPVRQGGAGAPDVSTYYLGINRGKRSIVLDLRDEADAELARELARRADVMIENFKPGALARYGLDFESVLAVNPGIVYSSITGFGTGAGRDVPGYDLMVQAISGLMSLTGDPDGPPYRAGISVFDVMAGNHATIGILAALRHRELTGDGQHVEVNLLSSALSGLVNHSSAYAAGGVVPYRMGNAHPSVFPYEPLPTADNDLIVAAANDGQFRKLCEVLGIPEIADDPRFARNADRTERREELRPILTEQLAKRGAVEWFDLLVEAGVPSGPINTIDGGFAMAQRFELDPILEVGDGDHAVPTTRNPLRFSRTPVSYRLPPPELDEHGVELRKWLATPEASAASEGAERG
jgi:crotonobetainyl-CoA:carnitine CoA-transferase CaiB-like acyl-CoA transferase